VHSHRSRSIQILTCICHSLRLDPLHKNGTVSHCDVSGGLFSGLAGGGNNDGGAYSRFELNHVHSLGSENDDGLCDFGGYHGSTGGSVLPM
jgi:hypothetical protein